MSIEWILDLVVYGFAGYQFGRVVATKLHSWFNSMYPMEKWWLSVGTDYIYPFKWQAVRKSPEKRAIRLDGGG